MLRVKDPCSVGALLTLKSEIALKKKKTPIIPAAPQTRPTRTQWES